MRNYHGEPREKLPAFAVPRLGGEGGGALGASRGGVASYTELDDEVIRVTNYLHNVRGQGELFI